MSTPSWRLPGKTVLITGAARGIGAERARRLAAKGMNVSLVGLQRDELAGVAADCGPGAVWFEADVTDRDQLQAAVDGTVDRLGGIDAVIATPASRSAARPASPTAPRRCRGTERDGWLART